MNIRRRLVLAAIAYAAGACLAGPPRPRGGPWRIGWLSPVRAHHAKPYTEVFVPAMKDLGYIEGRDFVVEMRYAEGDYARLPALARELVAQGVDLLLPTASNATRAAQGATRTLPIVFVSISDPVATGIVASLARPGGNTTGIANFTGVLIPKHVELLQGVLPRLDCLAVLVNPVNPSNPRILEQARAAAARSSLQVLALEASTDGELERAIVGAARERAHAIAVASDPFFYRRAARIGELALRHRLPSVFALRQHVEAGGLLSYGDDVFKIYRHAAVLVDKIFRGADPGELPVDQPKEFELAVNLKTAAQLGLTIPQDLLLRADRVIE
jgi:putative ABC transport system substrate-binding protein